jgi:hypothetical protein
VASNVFINTGNYFGANAKLGTRDLFGLTIITNDNPAQAISWDGSMVFQTMTNANATTKYSFSGTGTGTSGNGMFMRHTANPASSTASDFIGMLGQAQYSNSSNLSNGSLIGVKGYVFPYTSSSYTVLGTAIGVDSYLYSYRTGGSSSVSISDAMGYRAKLTLGGSASILNYAGLNSILNLSGATNSTGVLVSTSADSSIPSGNYAFYSRSAYDSYIAGNVGIGNAAPRAKLDVDGAIISKASVLNGTSDIDFSTGNIQYTNASCGAFNLNNLKDGGTYTLVIKGTTSATCVFTPYSGNLSGGLTPKYPPGHGATTDTKMTIYSFMVVGSDVFIAWVPGY